MSIRINKDKCIGCGKCTQVCPGTLIALEEGRARIQRIAGAVFPV